MRQQIPFQTAGNKITPLVVNPGRIVLTDRILYFQAYNNAEKNPVTKIKLGAIKRIFQRRQGFFFSFLSVICPKI